MRLYHVTSDKDHTGDFSVGYMFDDDSAVPSEYSHTAVQEKGKLHLCDSIEKCFTSIFYHYHSIEEYLNHYGSIFKIFILDIEPDKLDFEIVQYTDDYEQTEYIYTGFISSNYEVMIKIHKIQLNSHHNVVTSFQYEFVNVKREITIERTK